MGKNLLFLFCMVTFMFTSFVDVKAQDTITTYTEDFTNTVSLDLWRPHTGEHPDGLPIFNVSQSDGVLHNAVNQLNFWDGQNFHFTDQENVVFDITDNPYIAFDVRIDPGATYGKVSTDSVSFLVSPWGPDADGVLQREFLAINQKVPADGCWHTMKYNISDHFGLPDWDGAILENNYAEIEAILVENVIYPDTFVFNMDMDNFKVGEAAAAVTAGKQINVVTTYTEDFEGDVSLDLWRPHTGEHPDGTPIFDVSQSDGLLHNDVNQLNFWDGQNFHFTDESCVIFDITDNPYIAFDVRIDPGATYGKVSTDSVSFLVSPWGPDADGVLQREFLAINQKVPADGCWHTLKYNISDHFGLPDWDGAILENNYAEIEAILVENVIYPDTFVFNMDMDNFKVGAAAAAVTEGSFIKVLTSYTEDFENPVSLDLWRPHTGEHPDGTPIFDVSQSDGLLHNDVNQLNFWDGQNFHFTTESCVIFDITDNPYIAFDVRIDPGATYGKESTDSVSFLVSPWGPDADGVLQREFLAINQKVPADGCWHTMKYNISDHFGLPDWDGAILENNYAEIEAILVENVIYPDTFVFNMDMDNFKVGEAAAAVVAGVKPKVVTTYTEDFEDEVSLDLWRPHTGEHPDGTPIFDVSQSDGVLHNAVNQLNFWDGQNFHFTTESCVIFDITDNPYIAFDVRIDPGATYGKVSTDSVSFLVSPWGPDADGVLQREFLAINQKVPADGCWHTMKYNISDHFGLPDWDGAILENNYTEIEAILVENVIYPDTFVFNMDMDNFKVGEAAAAVVAGVKPKVVTTYTEDFEDEVSLDLWRPHTGEHPDGLPIFDVSQSDGVLHNAVNQLNFWDGQNFHFTEESCVIFDITDNPFISFDVRIDAGATYGLEATDSVDFLVSPWGPDVDGVLQREFLAINQKVPADGCWYTMKYNISDHFGLPDWDGAILENDYSEIEAILVENVIYPDTFVFVMDMDNFKVGDAAAAVVAGKIDAACIPDAVIDTKSNLLFDVYPNPVSHHLMVRSDEQLESIQVFDVQGRLMMDIDGQSQKLIMIDLSAYRSGAYLIKAQSKDRLNTKLIFKQ